MNVARASAVIALAGALFAFSAPVLAVESTLPSAGRITSDITSVMQRYNIPGATVVITRDGHVIYTHAFGSSDLATGALSQDDTHYEIGSITKQLTAAAILQLHEAGKIDIDAKVAVYVPSAPHANEITVRQLLTQTSGLPDYLDVTGVDSSKPATYDQLMASIAGKPLQFPPGSAWRYSNTNYIILGRIIENVSKERYEAYIKRHILEPLGMTNTFTIGDESSIPRMAFGYQLVDGHLSPVRGAISQSYAWSAGDLVSTVGDVEKWSSALQNGRVISPQDYALMITSQPTTQGESGYGFGLFIDSVDDQPRIGHTGGDPGFTAANEYFPKQNVRIVALTNDGNANGHPEAGEILTNVAFEAIHPEIAAAALRPAPGEDTAVTAGVARLFTSMQSGREAYSTLAPHLAERFKNQFAALFASEFAPYGAPTAFVFRGKRGEAGKRWFDYVVHFGPGVTLKFAVSFDQAGKITGLSFG
ncbi:MAG TPA: serine hydrolase domain-containing protein [Candidatus Tumulicola sp.]